MSALIFTRTIRMPNGECVRSVIRKPIPPATAAVIKEDRDNGMELLRKHYAPIIDGMRGNGFETVSFYP